MAWNIKQSEKLYNMSGWGDGYFSINKKGNVCVNSKKGGKSYIDLKQLIDDLIKRKIKLPILLRFMNILEDRIIRINKAFLTAIKENEYTGTYQTFYPIKVNQQSQVVEAVSKYGKKYSIGLEVGSKPELIAALSISNVKDIPIICNGYKDGEYIETILYAKKIGFNITIVVEKLFELETIIKVIKKNKIRPNLGIRIKLSSRGIGKWASSGGETAKFGLHFNELIKAVEILKENNLSDTLKLMHFHIGSQITKIDKLKKAWIEGARVYVELIKMGLNIEYIDIGGGLGVDYVGTKSNYYSSINYTIEEYANDVVFQIKTICDESKIKCPNLISESGRATVSHNSVLVTNLLKNTKLDNNEMETYIKEKISDSKTSTVKRLYDIYLSMDKHSLLEDYHDTIQLINEGESLFSLGYLSLHERALIEVIYTKIIHKINELLKKCKNIPDELNGFDLNLCETYFTNFSLFQSLPDSWAIDQLFPIMPIHRLKEKPEVIARIADITCDSDGQINKFVGEEGEQDYLLLHNLNDGEEYYLGFFLVGAYQEILGDLHNLFGDTNAVHISFNKKTGYKIDSVIIGDTVSESLKYVQYSSREILKNIREHLEKSVSKKIITIEESIIFLERFQKTLNDYTYFFK